jgi:hypothetical protein
MMPFIVNDRVQVSDQSSQYRNHLGTVVRVVDLAVDEIYVRIDGHERAGEVYFLEDELRTSTLSSPITY